MITYISYNKCCLHIHSWHKEMDLLNNISFPRCFQIPVVCVALPVPDDDDHGLACSRWRVCQELGPRQGDRTRTG